MRKGKKEPELIIEDITDIAPDLEPEEQSEAEKPAKKRKKSSHKKKAASDKTSEQEHIEEAAKDTVNPESEVSEVEKPKEKVLKSGKKAPKSADIEKEISEDAESSKDVSVREETPKDVSSENSASAAEGEVVIDMKNIVKRYFIGQPNELEVLHGIDMQVRRGEFVAIVGQSGSGKSTLMNMIGALDRPTEGEYTLDGVDMFKAKDKDLSAIRCKKIGFVFQTYNLVARTSALKNVELPMLYGGIPIRQRARKARELLDMVEMADRMKHQPDELSGGQKQRVAIARAMANDPAIILADEPTGALDSVTGRLIMDIFHKLHDEQGKTIILITHSPELAEECSRILTLKDGVIINERKGSGRNAVH